jgi:flagellin
MRINHNIAALNTYSRLTQATAAQGKSLEKLSSGQRINKAGDDAAGLAISEKMRNQIKGLNQAERNAQDGISMLQTAEGALGETHSMLLRMRELTVQGNNDTNTATDRSRIQEEIAQLSSEISSIGDKTEYNTKKLVDGTLGVKTKDGDLTAASLATAGISVEISGIGSGVSINFSNTSASVSVSVGGTTQTINVTTGTSAIAAGSSLNFDDVGVKLTFSAGTDASVILSAGASLGTSGNTATFQIGANSSQQLDISINNMKSTAIGNGTGSMVSDVDVTSTTQTFTTRLSILDTAINQVSAERSKMGAWQNRLEHTINNLSTSSENLTAAESRVRDVDMAKEMMEFTKNNILNQASTAMLAQANQQPQGVLQLLR